MVRSPWQWSQKAYVLDDITKELLLLLRTYQRPYVHARTRAYLLNTRYSTGGPDDRVESIIPSASKECHYKKK